MAETEEITFEESSGNIFADLGLPNAEELHARVKLAVGILRIIEDRCLTKAQAAKTLGLTQRRVTALQRLKLDDFTMSDLMHFASALEFDVVLELRPRSQRDGRSPVQDVHAA